VRVRCRLEDSTSSYGRYWSKARLFLCWTVLTWTLPEGGICAVFPSGEHVSAVAQAFVDGYLARPAMGSLPSVRRPFSW
jgi:hypothetical protein